MKLVSGQWSVLPCEPWGPKRPEGDSAQQTIIQCWSQPGVSVQVGPS